jgi:hypothetical protein
MAPGRDYLVLNFDGHPPPPLAALHGARGGHSMGSADRVRSDIDGALVDVDWTDPSRGRLDAGAVVLEFELGEGREGRRGRKGQEIDGFLVRARGGAREAAGLLVHLCRVNGWAALDCASGAFLDLEDPALQA